MSATNLFLTAASHGYVRLYDRRRPLPGLTFDIEKREAPLMAASFVHIDGLPSKQQLLSLHLSTP